MSKRSFLGKRAIQHIGFAPRTILPWRWLRTSFQWRSKHSVNGNLAQQETKMLEVEPLHPDLQQSLIEAAEGCWMIHHPVMVRFYYPGEDTARINHAYRTRLQYIAQAEAEGD